MTLLGRAARFYRTHRLIVADVCFLIALLGIALWVRTLAQQGDEAHAAVCALRHDLVIREKQGEDFLRAHPNGAFGFTAAQIQQNLSNEQRTIYALRGLRC